MRSMVNITKHESRNGIKHCTCLEIQKEIEHLPKYKISFVLQNTVLDEPKPVLEVKVTRVAQSEVEWSFWEDILSPMIDPFLNG